ncbi:MAG: hypothetical protein H0W53_03885 [Acidobacteria bacterium]|nr:hypothetical protein [Acidobacteriota bacterium]
MAILAAATVPNSNKSMWEPSQADLDALQATGREFVTSYLENYEVSAAEAKLLLELAQIVDRLSEVRTLRVDPLASIKERVALDRLEQGWLRLYGSFASMLKPEVL